MKKRSFNIPLSLDDVLHCEMYTENGKLVGFVLQYSAKIDGKVRIISCIDTHHNHAHKHIFNKNGKGTKRRIVLSEDISLYSNLYNEYLKKLKEDFLKNI